MRKSMKYELLKSKIDLLIMGIIFLILEAAFLLGIAVKNERIYMISVMGLSFFAIGCVMFVFISGILTFSRDLKEKSGYLVFMTPVSTYRVIGAKLLVLLVESVTFLAGFVVFTSLDITLALHAFGNMSWDDLIRVIEAVFSMESREDVLYGFANIGAALLMLFIFFYTVMTIIYFSVSLSATALQNKHGRGILAFGITLCLIVALIVIETKLPRSYYDLSAPGRAFVAIIPSIVFYAVAAVAAFIGTAKLLEKKISL